MLEGEIVSMPKYENFKHAIGNKYAVKNIEWDVAAEMVQNAGGRVKADTVAKALGVCSLTLRRKIREKYDMTWSEYRDQFIDIGNQMLMDKAFHMAFYEGHPTMLIFLLKNRCGMSDKHDLNVKSQENRVVTFALPKNGRELDQGKLEDLSNQASKEAEQQAQADRHE